MSLQALLGMASTLLMGVVVVAGVYYTYNYFQNQQETGHRSHRRNEYRSNEDFYASSGNSSRENWGGYDSREKVVCSICLDELMESRRNTQKLKCGHLFHSHCISRWLREQNNCPNCKANAV